MIQSACDFDFVDCRRPNDSSLWVEFTCINFTLRKLLLTKTFCVLSVMWPDLFLSCHLLIVISLHLLVFKDNFESIELEFVSNSSYVLRFSVIYIDCTSRLPVGVWFYDHCVMTFGLVRFVIFHCQLFVGGQRLNICIVLSLYRYTWSQLLNLTTFIFCDDLC